MGRINCVGDGMDVGRAIEAVTSAVMMLIHIHIPAVHDANNNNSTLLLAFMWCYIIVWEHMSYDELWCFGLIGVGEWECIAVL